MAAIALKRRVARGFAYGAVAMLIILARVLYSSHAEWKAAEAERAAGRAAQAVDGWGRAARLYAPGNPWSTAALERLAETARNAEAAGDAPLALSAWRELRASILGTRSIYTPHAALLAEADAHIATLAARTEAPSVAPGKTEAERAKWHAERLARDEMPSVAWSIAALLGLLVWVGAAIGFAWDGLDADDRLRRDHALAWAIAVAAGFGLFLLGLARA